MGSWLEIELLSLIVAINKRDNYANHNQLCNPPCITYYTQKTGEKMHILSQTNFSPKRSWCDHIIDNLGSWILVCNLILTQQEENWRRKNWANFILRPLSFIVEKCLFHTPGELGFKLIHLESNQKDTNPPCQLAQHSTNGSLSLLCTSTWYIPKLMSYIGSSCF